MRTLSGVSLCHRNGAQGLRHRLLKAASRIIADALTVLAVGGMIISSPGMAFAIDAGATPQGGNVVAGSATFNRPSADRLIVNQQSQRAVVDWASFDIGQNASTEFKQPGASSLTVNRVTGASTDPTQILGTLKSNGRVMVLDPNGVLFGQNSRVDVGGLIASTGSVNVNQVMSGAAEIAITNIGGNGSVVNEGQITARDGGLVALVAPHVVNSGMIAADIGRVELASGMAVTVDLYGDKLVELAVNGALANALVENSGTIVADGGRVGLTARAAQGVVNNVINTTGIIQANTINQKAGRIVLRGNDAGTVHVSGEIKATGKNGGRVDVTGKRIFADNARIDVSGTKGGGEIYLGGGVNGTLDGLDILADVIDVSGDTVLNADGLKNGNGGTIVVWGNEHTGYYGTATARGGVNKGNGGFVEVSAGDGVVFAGKVDTTAPKGLVGQLLIDPLTASIGNGTQLADGTYLNAQYITNNLVFTSILIQAGSSIDIVDHLSFASSPFGTPAHDLTFMSPTFNLNKNINMGAFGNLYLAANTVNMGGRITSGSTLINSSRISSTATQVNVLSNAASIQQAMDISSSTAPATIQVSAGQYNENLIIRKTLRLTGNGGGAEAGADANAPVLYGLQSGGDIITVTANGVTIDGLHLNASVDGGDSVNGIFASGVSDLAIAHNTLEGFAASGISTPGSNNATLNANLNVLSSAQQAAAEAAAQAAAEAAAQAAAEAAAQAAAEAAAQAAAEAAAQAAAEAAAQAAAEAAAQAAAEAAAQAAAEAAAQAAAEAAAQAAAEAAAQAAAEAAAQAAAEAAAQAAAEAAAQAAAEAAAHAAAIAAAQVAVQAARAEVELAKAEVRMEKAEFQAEKAEARLMAQELKGKKTPEEKAALQAARAEAQAAKNELRAARAELLAARTALKAAKVALKALLPPHTGHNG